MQPDPIPPFARNGPIRGQIPAGGLRAAAPPAGQLAGLRAVSLREGSAIIVFGGESRALRPGDRVGTATVKAVGADRIILEQAQTTPPTGTRPRTGLTTIVVTFDPSGQPRVRTYAPMDASAEPPEVR